MATIKCGMYAGKNAHIDGPVKEVLQWDTYKDMITDYRPVVTDFANRIKTDRLPFEKVHDMDNLVYTHVDGHGHIFHKSELNE